MEKKLAFETSENPTPAELRLEMAAAMLRVAEDLATGQDGGPQDELLTGAMVVLQYETGARIVTLAEDKYEALHQSLHVLERALCKELIRMVEAGEEVQICTEIAAVFRRYLEKEGIPITERDLSDMIVPEGNDTVH